MTATPTEDLATLRLYRTLVDNMPNGVLVLFDADLRYDVLGPEVLPFSGRVAADMAGRTIDDLFPQPTADRLRPELRATVDGEDRSFDIEYDGLVHHTETRHVAIDGAPFGVLLTQDVTKPRSLADELRRQNERLDEFASMLSHDIKNPLAIAHGHLATFRETGDPTHLDAIEGSLDRIDDLVVDMLGLARHGAPAEAFAAVALDEVAESAWTFVDTRSATLETDPVTVTGDEGQLRALLENCFRNAVGHGGDEVTVRVGPLPDGFFVEDTGSGIPPADRETVFRHGYSSGYGGSGVGLSIVRRIAEEHGLTVELGASAEGGARFEFRTASSGSRA